MIAAADLVTQATDVVDLGRRLGSVWLDHSPGIDAELRRNDELRVVTRHIEALTVAVPAPAWHPATPGAGCLTDALTEPLRASLDLVAAEPGADCAALLRGLCVAVLEDLFATTFADFILERGSPYPLPRRRVDEAVTETTAFFSTTRFDAPLADLNFAVYSGDLGPVCMTFGARDEVDEACWTEKTDNPDRTAAFGTIATLHPYPDGTAIRVPPDVVNDDWWFGTGPTEAAWSRNEIVDQLRQAKGDPAAPRVAVLPELCLPDTNALQDVLVARHDEFPPVVCAGSAHEERGAERVNEAVLYVEGAAILRHRKRHPFQTRSFGGHGTLLPEGITEPGPLTIAAGRTTHLGVLICVDAMDPRIVATVVELAVNSLVIPALSPSTGSFNHVLAATASQCQGTAVIVNGTPPDPTDDPLFMVAASAPHRHLSDQTREFLVPHGRDRRAVGIFDPNLPLTSASVRWLPADTT